MRKERACKIGGQGGAGAVVGGEVSMWGNPWCFNTMNCTRNNKDSGPVSATKLRARVETVLRGVVWVCGACMLVCVLFMCMRARACVRIT